MRSKNPFPKRPSVGRRGMPRKWVDAMYREYLRVGSVAKVGEKYGRCRQGIWELFKARGLKLNEKKFLPKVEHNGVAFTLNLSGGRGHHYYRSTSRKDEVLLHHAIWEEVHGPIPSGHVLRFKDGNSANCALDNLELLSRSEQQDLARDGSNQFTRSAGKRLSLLLRSAQGEKALAAQIARRAA